MKKLAILLLLLAGSFTLNAQPEDVRLIVSGEGKTKGDAINNALRSAVEQAFGAFVSANTVILNDELIKDEVATISSGNIKEYKELASVQLPDGTTSVQIDACVSIGKLVTYAKSHGSSAEFAGNTFLANIRLRELNKDNEASALLTLSAEVKALSKMMFDFQIIPDKSPKMDNTTGEKGRNGYIFNNVVNLFSNSISVEVFEMIRNTLSALSLSRQERAEYESNSYDYTTFVLNGERLYFRSDKEVLQEFKAQLKEALLVSMFDVSITTISPNPIEFIIDYSTVEHIASYTDMGRAMKVVSDGVRYDDKVKYSKDFLPLLLSYRAHGWGYHYLNYDEELELYIPNYGQNQKEGKLFTSYTVPMFVEKEDIGSLNGFELLRKK